MRLITFYLVQKYSSIKTTRSRYLSNGELAIDDKSLSLLDFAIVSIHSVFSMNKANMTKRVIEGFLIQKQSFAHPTGRLLNQRPGYELDWENNLNFAKIITKHLKLMHGLAD